MRPLFNLYKKFNFSGDRREARGWFGGGMMSAPAPVVYSDARQRRGWFNR